MNGILSPGEVPRHRVFVRVSVSYWADSRGIHSKKSVTYLKRLSTGHNFVREDVSNMDAKSTWELFQGIETLRPGVYEVLPTDHIRDWETGVVESWEYKFIPVKES